MILGNNSSRWSYKDRFLDICKYRGEDQKETSWEEHFPETLCYDRLRDCVYGSEIRSLVISLRPHNCVRKLVTICVDPDAERDVRSRGSSFRHS